MEKKQTALKELIGRLKYLSIEHDDAGIRTAIDISTELLVKEREQIEEAYKEGQDGCIITPNDASNYYSQTFKP
jgi:hypothetical protein